MYVSRNITARSHNHCYRNEEMHSLFIVDTPIAVNNIIPLSVDMETQQQFTFALLSSYKIFCTAVNNKP